MIMPLDAGLITGYYDPITKCPKCGINLLQIMSYTCMEEDCPTGLGSYICLGNDKETQ